jgi:hypothetical protein
LTTKSRRIPAKKREIINLWCTEKKCIFIDLNMYDKLVSFLEMLIMIHNKTDNSKKVGVIENEIQEIMESE